MAGRKADGDTQLEVWLWGLDDLLQAPEPRLMPLVWRTESGIDDLLLQLRTRSRRRRRQPRSVWLIQAAGAPVLDAAELEHAVRGYCDVRAREVSLRLRAHRREEIGLFLLGSVLFLIGVALSAEFLQSYWPSPVQDLFGDGVFLVVAWVGLWYPLDHFVFDRRALTRERDDLLRLRNLPLQVVPASGGPE